MSSVLIPSTNMSAHEIFVHRFPLQIPLTKSQRSFDWYSVRFQISVPDLYRNLELLNTLKDRHMTIRDYLVEIGFPDPVILADPGSFETEARKTKLDLPLGNRVHLSDRHILDAYKVIDPDFIVAPSEMILDLDRPNTRRSKMDSMKRSLDRLVDLVPARKIMATLQGTRREEIDTQLNIIGDRGITKVGRGSLLPLRKFNYNLYSDVVDYSLSQMKSREMFAHVFGVGSVEQVLYYLQSGFDSLDSPFLYYQTKQSKFLTPDTRFISATNRLSTCKCRGCTSLQDVSDPRSAKFALGLYMHNMEMLNSIVDSSDSREVTSTGQEPFTFTTAAELRATEPVSNQQSIPGVRKSSHTPLEHIVTNASQIKPVDYNRFEKKYRSDSKDPKPSNQPVNDEQTLGLLLQEILPEIKKTRGSICMISCGTKSKRPWHPKEMVFQNTKQLQHRDEIATTYRIMQKEAGDLYTGKDHQIMSELVRRLERSYDIDHRIISAGYGLLDPQERIVSYDCSFVGKSFNEVVQMSIQTKLGADLQRVIDSNYSLIIFNLSHSYQIVKELVTFRDSSSRIVELDFDQIHAIDVIELHTPD